MLYFWKEIWKYSQDSLSYLESCDNFYQWFDLSVDSVSSDNIKSNRIDKQMVQTNKTFFLFMCESILCSYSSELLGLGNSNKYQQNMFSQIRKKNADIFLSKKSLIWSCRQKAKESIQNIYLTLKVPSKICSRWHSKIIFYFSEKISLDILCESSVKAIWSVKTYFLRKKKSKCCLLQLKKK